MDSRTPELPAHVIDPTQMSPIDEYIVGSFLTASFNRDRRYIDMDNAYRMPKLDPSMLPASMLSLFHALPSYFEFTYKLISRSSASNPHEYRYDVYSGKVIKSKSNSNDECVFGDIEEIIGTLAPRADGRVVYKSNKQRVAKFQAADHSDDLDRIGVEVELTQRVPHLHAKAFTLFSSGQKTQSAFVMRYLKGGDLLKFYQKDVEEKARASHAVDTNRRIELSLAVLRALKMQVHANNIVHRDLKLANIMADYSAKYIDAYIIDYGLSCSSLIDDGKRQVGTPLYAPPEYYNKTRQTRKSDIYSMGWVLAMIWRAENNLSKTWDVAKQLADACRFQGMFYGIGDLHDNHKMSIEFAILKMVSCQPEKRRDIDSVVHMFERVLLERKCIAMISDGNEALISPFKHANKAALKLRDELDALSSGECANFMYNLDRLQSLVLKSLDGIVDHPLVVTEFVERLQVVMLRGCITKEEVGIKLQTVMTIYKECYTQLVGMQAMMKLLQVNLGGVPDLASGLAMRRVLDLDSKLRLLLAKGVGAMNLDGLVSLNRKFIKKLAVFQEEYDELLALGAVKICLKSVNFEGSGAGLLIWGEGGNKASFFNASQDYQPISSVFNQSTQVDSSSLNRTAQSGM